MLEELYMLRIKQGITPIIAHIDRYFGFFKIDMLYDLLDNGVEIQINADAFLRFGTRRRAQELLKMGMVQYLGSDAHNMGKRAPRIGEAISEIEKRLGKETIDMILSNGNRLAKEATPLFQIEDR
jgi:protein-tyrosine phosphatase